MYSLKDNNHGVYKIFPEETLLFDAVKETEQD